LGRQSVAGGHSIWQATAPVRAGHCRVSGNRFQARRNGDGFGSGALAVYQAAWLHDSGAEDVKQKSSMAKLNATEAAQRIIDQALQIHGANGLIAGSITERLYRDVRALRIYEGTSEFKKLINCTGVTEVRRGKVVLRDDDKAGSKQNRF
jgi:alkylation response protein AidB-like acyl-CoA dehydrogenase